MRSIPISILFVDMGLFLVVICKYTINYFSNKSYVFNDFNYEDYWYRKRGCLTTEVRQSLFLCKNQIIQAAFFLQRI